MPDIYEHGEIKFFRRICDDSNWIKPILFITNFTPEESMIDERVDPKGMQKKSYTPWTISPTKSRDFMFATGSSEAVMN